MADNMSYYFIGLIIVLGLLLFGVIKSKIRKWLKITLAVILGWSMVSNAAFLGVSQLVNFDFFDSSVIHDYEEYDEDEIDENAVKESYRAVVQNVVNRYGIADSEKMHDAIYNSETGDIKGLWEAKAFDVNEDDVDELMLVYLDKGMAYMQLFEYESGTAVKKWSESVCWGMFYTFNVRRLPKKVYWSYGIVRGNTSDVISYIDGEYVSAYDMGNYTEEEKNYIYDGSMMGLMMEYKKIADVYKKRVGVENDDNAETLISLSGEGVDKEALISRWNLTVPEPRMSPSEILSQVRYYGNPSLCKMTEEMALAYARAVESEEDARRIDHNDYYTEIYGVLMDLAGDGMPILVTVWASEHYSADNIAVWCWDGSKAYKYDFDADAHAGAWDHRFYPGNSHFGMICLSDGVGHDAMGDVGRLAYNVSNAQIKLIRHTMAYKARTFFDEPDIARGSLLPGIKAVKEDDGEYVASVDDLLKAGWKIYGNESNYKILTGYYINDKIVSESEWGDYTYFVPGKSYNIYEATTGGAHITGTDWVKADKLKNMLKSYAKIAGRPYYSYEEVKSILSKSQLSAIEEIVSKKIEGRIGEIYRLSSDMYYVVIYDDDAFVGGVLIKNTKNGKQWKIIKSSSKALTEEVLTAEASKDAEISNIRIDYKTVDNGAEYLKKVLGDIDGSTPNDTARDEIANYIKNYVSTNSVETVKAKKNTITLKPKTIRKLEENAAEVRDELESVITDEEINLNKAVDTVLKIECEKLDLSKKAKIVLDEALLSSMGSADELVFILSAKGHSISVSVETLKVFFEEYSSIEIVIQMTDNGAYDIIFYDEAGEEIDKLEAKISVTLPASDELCTVQAQYGKNSDNWGGQYDASNGTITFETAYTGTYSVITEKAKISDISELSDEEQKAVRFMVSKGFFSLDGSKFNPDATLTRYAFSEAVVRMFFDTDHSLKTSFSDVPEKNRYYPYVASGEKRSIIEGYEDDTFRGENDVLVEEAIALCSRTLADDKGYKIPKIPEDYLHFTDNDAIDWAKEDIALAVRDGLIDDGGMLKPKNAISRVDSAVLLYKLFMLLYDVEPVNTAAAATKAPGIAWVIFAVVGIIIVLIIAALIVLIIKMRSQKKAENQEVITEAAIEHSGESSENSETEKTEI